MVFITPPKQIDSIHGKFFFNIVSNAIFVLISFQVTVAVIHIFVILTIVNLIVIVDT